jgi:hypothetical protein
MVVGVAGWACNVPPPPALGIAAGAYVLTHWAERKYPRREVKP